MGQDKTNRPSAVAYIRSFDRDRRNDYDGLPPPRANHWVARQKRAVVEAIDSGRLSLREAMNRYELSIEEFETWQKAYGRQDRRLPEPAPRTLRELRFGCEPRVDIEPRVEAEPAVERARELERLN